MDQNTRNAQVSTRGGLLSHYSPAYLDSMHDNRTGEGNAVRQEDLHYVE